MEVILDDIDARPGSTTSILRTVIGLYLRRLDGWVAISDIVRLMEDLGVPAARTRTAVVRLKKKGLLIPDRVDAIGYRLNPEAERMLRHGDRRIFAIREMREGDRWCLVSFSIPESQRDLRHQLRRRLQWIGCGVVSQALWICPDYLCNEVEQILDDLEVRHHATVFRTEDPRPAGPLVDAVRQWWDLDALRAEHEEFQNAVAGISEDEPSDEREAFIGYVRLIDSWRVLPYVDPGLPHSLLPDDWPGARSFETFTRLSRQLAEPAWAHVISTVEHASDATGGGTSWSRSEPA